MDASKTNLLYGRISIPAPRVSGGTEHKRGEQPRPHLYICSQALHFDFVNYIIVVAGAWSGSHGSSSMYNILWKPWMKQQSVLSSMREAWQGNLREL